MSGLMRKSRILGVALVLATPIACDSDTVPGGSGAQTGTQSSPGIRSSPPSASPSAQSPTRTRAPSTPAAQSPTGTRAPSTPAAQSPPASPPPPRIPEAAPPLPQEFEGLWTSVGQGSAETIYRFRRDGSYDKVSILLQQRPSGKFSFTITASGSAAVSGNLLTFTPAEGTQTMEDPDSPSSNFDKPLEDLTPEKYLWQFQNGQLILSDKLGSVAYTWEADK